MFKVEYVIKDKGSTVAAFISGAGQTRTVPAAQFAVLRGKLSNAVVTEGGVLRGLPGSGGLPARTTIELNYEKQQRKQAQSARWHERQRQQAEFGQRQAETETNPSKLFTILADMVWSLQHSEFADSFLLKGAFVLMSAVRQSGINDLTRGTEDIDMNFHSLERWELLVSQLCDILNRGTRIRAHYTIKDRRGINLEYLSDSISLDVVVASKHAAVKIDMNVKPLLTKKANYTLPELSFSGADMYTMLSDKLKVLSSGKMIRRIKDLTDVYIISCLRNFRLTETVSALRALNTEISQPIFLLDGNHIEGGRGMRRAYDKQVRMRRLNVEFDVVFVRVLNFSIPIYQGLVTGEADKYAVWSTEKGKWTDDTRRYINN
jgi:hypothetical protein